MSGVKRSPSLSAQEIFDKFEPGLNGNNPLEQLELTLAKVMIHLGREVRDACLRTDMTNDLDVAWMLQVQNYKWNEFCDIFDTTYNVSIMKKDSFLDFWKNKMPEFAHLL